MKIYRFRTLPDTSVLFSTHQFTLKVDLRTRLSKRHRRQILLALFRILRPHYSTLFASHLSHDDSLALDMIKDFMRPVSMYQALNLETPSGHEGFVIRARRLRFGLSQEAFAKLAGVDRGRLSRIEHGHAKMSPLFRTKLFQAFNKLEMSGHGKTQLPTRIRRRV